MRDAIALAALLDDGNLRAFLAVIRKGEGTADEAGYRRHFGGRLFDSFVDHPRVVITAGLGANQYTSTAAGAYQFLARTWDGLVKRYGFADFAPRTQDIAAVALIDGRKALDDVLAGRFAQAVHKCNREWASLPGSPYGQPVKTQAQAEATYRAHGGLMRPQGESQALPLPVPIPPQENAAALDLAPAPHPSPLPKEPTMPLPAILGVLLPSIIESIPKLGKLFGSGSQVAERNVQAAAMAVNIVQEAVGARNAQEAAEVIKADPAVAQVAQAAVEARWYELTESGGGGIAGARKANAELAASGASGLLTPAFIVSLVLILMPMMLLVDVFFVHPDNYPGEMRTQVITGVLMVIGVVGGYWLGSSFGSARKTEIQAGQP